MELSLINKLLIMVTGSVGVGVVGLGVGDGVGEGVGAGVGLHAKTGVSYDAGLEKRGSLLPVTCAHHFASKKQMGVTPSADQYRRRHSAVPA
jgi:hypothetical protein